MRFKKSIVGFITAALVVSACQFASANIVNVGDIISLSSPSYRIGNGGEFAVNRVSPNAQNNLFRTFCVELTENISFDTPYMLGGITTTTAMSNMALTTATAALYLGFRSGTGDILGQSYDYNGGALQGTDGQSLQLAIWKTMGWNVTLDAKAQAWVTAANLAVLDGTGDAFGWVRIMNIVGVNGTGNFQDQLILIPEPGSMLVWGVFGLAGFGFSTIRRRKV